MKKVTIGICLCLFIILHILIACLLIIRKICLKLPQNLFPFACIPLLVTAALIARTYDNIDGIVDYEFGNSSFDSHCAEELTSAIPNIFVALAMYLNLVLWLNFVLASYYDVQQRFADYLRLRNSLLVAFCICAFLLVAVPLAIFAFLECEDLLENGIVILVASTFSVFAVLIPVVGTSLLLILKRYFFPFYTAIRANTIILLAC